MVNFQLISMSSYAKNKQQMCWVTQHQCRSRQMWKISQIHPVALTFCLLQKWLFLPEQSIHGKVSTHKDVLLCSESNYRCVELLNVSVEVAKCGKYSQIHPVHSLFIYYKKWPVLTEQSIHGKFQLISMSSYAKNKQQMGRVTQHQCNVVKCGKYSQIRPVHWLFVYYKKSCHDWTIYSW